MRNAVRTVIIFVPFSSCYLFRRPLEGRMYHLFRGFHEYLTRKDEFSIVIIGLDNVSLSLPLLLRQADGVHRRERRSVLAPGRLWMVADRLG
jgi:hypothetical protein